MDISSPSKRRRVYEEIPDSDSSDEENSDEDKSYEENSGNEDKSDEENSETDVSKEEKQLKDELLKVLTKIHEKKTFEFVVGSISTELPSSPGIKIPGYGPVSLPITENTIKKLKKHFHQAPYGLGEATLIDKTVRDSWQLDPEDFVISNPNFNAGVEKLVREIKDGLDCGKQKVTSHLYKLLLYERGGHFKPHRDTEKHKGMFATLIIQLPSIFTGGDLVVKHGAREKRIVFGNPQSEFSCMYAAHYADCEHELTEITSGYRMALVYSLCSDGNGTIPTPSEVPVTKLEGLLKKIDEVLPHPSIIAWGLDHHYSENSFLNKGIQALKGGDKHIYSSLRVVNDMLEEDKKLDFFIVDATKIDNMYGSCTLEYGGRYWCHTSEDCFDNDGDCETEFEFKVIGSDGKLWKGTSEFDLDVKKDVLNVGKDDDEFWGECNEGECSGPSGNEGASKTNWYQRYVLVIFPKENAIKIVYKNSVDSAIDYLEQQLQKGASSMRKLAGDIVDLCVQQKQKFCRSENNVVDMLTLILKLKELDLAKKIIPLLSEPLVSDWHSQRFYWESSHSKFAFGIPSEKTICVLKDLIKTFGWQPLDDSVSTLIQSCPPKQFGNIIELLEQCPQVVNKEELIVNKIQQALNLALPEGSLKDESIMAICLYICNHLQTCHQFLQPFLDTPKLQNLQILIEVLSLLKKELGVETKDSKFYQMTLAKFWEQLQKLFQAGKVTPFMIDAVVKAADFLVSLRENSLLEKLVEQVLLNPNENLLKKLLAGNLCYSVVVSEPVKRLIETRINQLLPLVQAGKPVISWCQPTAILPDYPEVQAFLRGPKKSFIYNKFTAKCQAKVFEKDYFKGRGNGTYSAVIKVIGCRNDTQVEITKLPPNRSKHEEAVREYVDNCGELKRLQSKIDGK